MNGINNKPFIDCAPYVDIQGLKQLELEICTGIALSDVKAGVYGPGVANAERYGNFMQMKAKMVGDTTELGERWKRMTHNQQNLFAKLHFHLYNPSTVVYIREPKRGIDPKVAYLRKGQDASYDWTASVVHFPGLKTWLDAQVGTVFEQIGRVLFFIHDHDSTLLLHRDGVKSMTHRSEFLWLNPTGLKKFYVYDEDSDIEHTVDTPAAFFNDLDMHGGQAVPQMTWSLRIDGVYTPEFRAKLGISHLDHY